MKKIFAILGLSVAIAINAQVAEKVSPAGRIIFNDYLLQIQNRNNTHTDFNTNSSETAPVVSAIVILKPGYKAEMIRQLDIEVTADLGSR